MKYWTEKRHGKISINDVDGDLRTLSVKMMHDGTVLLREECDGYFCAQLSRDEAVDALKEAIDYIQSYNAKVTHEMEGAKNERE